MVDEPKTLIVFSTSYPVKNGETFLANEMEILKDHFDRIIVFCTASGEKWYWEVPGNVAVIQLDRVEEVSYNKAELVTLVFQDLFLGNTKLKRLRENLSLLKKQFYLTSAVKVEINTQGLNNAIFYSYWFDEWVNVLSLLKRSKTINSFITRAHRFDLFEESRPNGVIPFRNFQLKWVDQIYSVSEMGSQYLKQKYPSHKHKISTSYLGTYDSGINPISNEVFHIVSCSRLVKVKRLELILTLLKGIDFSQKIVWTHFGDGPLLQIFKEKAEDIMCHNSKIEIVFKGHTHNTELLKFYSCVPISAFINVSTSEGLPVSLMEAASFGIPMIATDVGGTKEIVNNLTGVLISSNPSMKELSEAIDSVKSNYQSEAIRQEIRAYWKTHFDARMNYLHFVDQLKTSQG